MLLEFPPSRKKASRVNTPEAVANKQKNSITPAMLEQALSHVSAYSQAVQHSLVTRAAYTYLAERGLV